MEHPNWRFDFRDKESARLMAAFRLLETASPDEIFTVAETVDGFYRVEKTKTDA